jgi:hypothetical protein
MIAENAILKTLVKVEEQYTPRINDYVSATESAYAKNHIG